ncbi:DEAD/DEAH box helicase family protein [candidate division KSB1 bacterium]|nr:DEAD/DEAH box helicase family protein [candidate division KSB1 bacterium]
MAAVNSNKYLSPKVRQTILREINGNSGNEVFFYGTVDDSGQVKDVEALAWGNETSTPAILQKLLPGDIVIHNHPAGDLTPSDADIQIASFVGNHSVGFYIIDNKAEFLNVIVKRHAKKPRAVLDPQETGARLDENSAIAENLPGYESRPGQVDMTEEVVNSFNKGMISLIEAGTGTGKTLAYLVPSILWALKHKERVVLSTKTINLQEQLVFKDIPFLKNTMAEKFSYVLVKGRRNYLCLRRSNAEDRDLGLFSAAFSGKDDSDPDELRALIEWSKTTKDGSLSDLNFIPKPEVWDRLKCESDTCTGVRCAFYDDCFLLSARREAAKADILIVNHHLLFADLSLRGSLGSLADIAVLPPYKRIIIDEAHHIEGASTDYFGSQVSQLGLERLFGRLYSKSKKGENKGLIAVTMSKLRNVKEKQFKQKIREVITGIEANIVSEITGLRDYNNDIFDDIGAFLKRKNGSAEGTSTFFGENKDENQFILDERFYEDRDWTELILVKIEGFVNRMKSFRVSFNELTESLGKLVDLLNIDLENLLIELRAQVQRINDAAETLHYLMFIDDASVVKWIEISGKQRAIKICAAPIKVGESLRNALFNPYETVVMTSATLSVGGSFEFIKSRLGIDELDQNRVSEMSFPSPFDFQKQALIGIPTNNHPPDHPRFSTSTHNLIAESIKISKGRAFALFTSYAAMNDAYSYITSNESAGWNPPIRFLKQGTDTRHNLLNQFKQEKVAVLFATDSFWEGVDVTGESLESIIITRLPFKVPTAPIEVARRDAIDREGGNSFLDYSVPHAVIKFKQGIGRLIRNKSDRGTILILDNRIIKKKYGKIFLDSLPHCTVIADRDDVVFKAFREFYEK